MIDPVKSIKPLGFQWETADPFLFCVHHEDKFPKGNDAMGPVTSMQGRSLGDDFIIKDGFRMYHGKTVPGFPGHPHRGFETVTVVRKGLVDHADSLGAAGRYGNGDVQWMTAGKGVQHSEMFPLLEKEKENPMELFQIWLNLPAKDKMCEPHFTMFWREQIQTVEHLDAQGLATEVVVVAGQLADAQGLPPPPHSWASQADADLAIFTIRMAPGAQWTLPKASHAATRRQLYFFQGQGLKIDAQPIPTRHVLEVKAQNDLHLVNIDALPSLSPSSRGTDGDSTITLRSDPMAVVLDVILPGMDGFETCRQRTIADNINRLIKSEPLENVIA